MKKNAYTLLLFVSILITGCASITPSIIPTNSSSKHINSRDTVVKMDSIYIYKNTIIKEADSTDLAKIGLKMNDMQRSWIIQITTLQREITRLKEKSSDTIRYTDTIYQPYPVEKTIEVPADLSVWQNVSIRIGHYTILLFIILLGWFVTKKFILKI